MSAPASCEGGLTKFSSSEGREYCRNTLRCLLPHDTHDFQLNAIGHLLDGQDTLLVTATGSGKTDTFIRLMRLISYISAHPNEIPGVTFPPDPAMIIICPTKMLEEEMVRFISFRQNKGTHLDFPGGKNEKMRPPIIGHQFRYHQNGETIQESRFVSGCTEGSHDDSPITGATEVEVV